MLVQFIKKHKKKLLLLIFLVVASCLIFLNFQALSASAKWYDAFLPGKDDAEKALKFLNRYADKLIYSDNPMKSMLHTVGWFLVECCYKLSYFFETSLDGASLLSLFSFVDGKDAKIHGIYSGVMTGVVWGLLVLTLCFCGYKLILGKSNDLKNLGVNICLSVVLLVLMPTLFGTGKISGESFARALYNDAKDINTSGKSKGESLSFSLIRENCTDWIYVSQNSKWGDIDKGKQVNALSETKFKRGTYPLSNLITSKAAADLDTDDGKYLQYHLSQDDHDDTKAIKSTSLMSWAPKAFQSGYYQYTLTSTFGVLIGLLALVVAFAFNAFVIIRTVIELAFKRVIAPVVFATDVETLQKSKMVLTDIMKGYLTIGLTELSMVIFQFWITFVNTKNMNLMLKVIAYCAGVWVLIVGSTSVLRYFDVDIGLQQGKQGLGAGLAVGAAIGKGGKSVKSAIGNATGSAVAGIAGGAAGIMNGLQKGAGMKLSQAVVGGSTAGSSKESLTDQSAETQQRQDSKQKPENSNNIQARKPSLVRRAARATGNRIQQSAQTQMQKHPGAAKAGSIAGGIAGGAAGLGVRAGKKLSGLDQSPASQQNGSGQPKNVAQTRSDVAKTTTMANDPLKNDLKRPGSSLSEKSVEQEQAQKAAFNEAKNENYGRPLGKETASSVQGQQSEQNQESNLEDVKADEEEYGTLSENQDQFDNSKEEELNTGDQETASSVQGQQLDQNQESSLENAKAPVKAAGQRPSQRQAETGGSPTTTTTRQTSVQQSQVQKRPETPREATQVQTEAVEQQSTVENPSGNSTITATAGQTIVQHQQAQEYQQPEVHQVETRTEAPQTQQAQERQEVHQAETPSIRQQEVVQSAEATTTTPAGTHDYSQIINGGTTTTDTGSQTQSVQPAKRVQQSKITTTTVQKPQVQAVQKQKRPETPPATKPADNPLMDNPWGDIQNDRSR